MAALLHGHAHGRQRVERIGFGIEIAVGGSSACTGVAVRRRQQPALRPAAARSRQLARACTDRRCHRRLHGLHQRRIKGRIRPARHRPPAFRQSPAHVIAGSLVVSRRRFIGGQGIAAIGNRRFRGGRLVVADILFAGALRALSARRFGRSISYRRRFVLGLIGVNLSEAGRLVPGLSGLRRGIGGGGLSLGLRGGLKKRYWG